MTRSTARRCFLALRLAAGIVFAVAPSFAPRLWRGADPDGAATTVPLRAMGARDIALSAGALLSERRGRNASPWLHAAAVAEGADALAVLAVRRALSTPAPASAVVGPAVLAAIATGLARP
jgi:hypothetical protein